MSNKEQLTEEQKLAQFAAMLEGNFDDIEDLPDYAVFEPGAYNLRGVAAKVVAEKGRIQFTFEKLSLVELDEAAGGDAEKVPVDGALLGATFAQKFGLQKLKKLFAPTLKHLGAESIVQFVDQFENLNFTAVISKREHEGKFYNDIVEIVLTP